MSVVVGCGVAWRTVTRRCLTGAGGVGTGCGAHGLLGARAGRAAAVACVALRGVVSPVGNARAALCAAWPGPRAPEEEPARRSTQLSAPLHDRNNQLNVKRGGIGEIINQTNESYEADID